MPKVLEQGLPSWLTPATCKSRCTVDRDAGVPAVSSFQFTWPLLFVRLIWKFRAGNLRDYLLQHCTVQFSGTCISVWICSQSTTFSQYTLIHLLLSLSCYCWQIWLWQNKLLGTLIQKARIRAIQQQNQTESLLVVYLCLCASSFFYRVALTANILCFFKAVGIFICIVTFFVLCLLVVWLFKRFLCLFVVWLTAQQEMLTVMSYQGSGQMKSLRPCDLALCLAVLFSNPSWYYSYNVICTQYSYWKMLQLDLLQGSFTAQ